MFLGQREPWTTSILPFESQDQVVDDRVDRYAVTCASGVHSASSNDPRPSCAVTATSSALPSARRNVKTGLRSQRKRRPSNSTSGLIDELLSRLEGKLEGEGGAYGRVGPPGRTLRADQLTATGASVANRSALVRRARAVPSALNGQINPRALTLALGCSPAAIMMATVRT
jgi:hypothetical protein